MAGAAGEEERTCSGEDGADPIRFLGILKANKRVAYVLAVMVMVHLSNQYNRYLFSVAKVPFLNYESYDFALIAGPFFTAVNSVAGVVLSLLGDVRPVRVLCTACVLWSASTGAVAFSRNFWQVALARAGQGIGDAACNPFAASILRDHFGPDMIGSAIGVYFTGLYAGFSLSLGLGTFADDRLGWKWTYWIAAMGGFVVAAMAFLTVPEPAPSLRGAQSEDLGESCEVISTGVLARGGGEEEYGSTNGSNGGVSNSLGRTYHAGSTGGYEDGRAPVPDAPPPPPPPPPAPRERLWRPSDASTVDVRPMASPVRRFRKKLPDLSAAWLGSPALLLVCVAGGVRDAGGFVFGYYLASYFSPLMDANARLTNFGRDPCEFSYDPSFSNMEQICDEGYPWCIDGECNRLSGAPWHDVGMDPARLEWFVSWVPLVGGSLGAMIGGFLSDRVARRRGTAGRLWVVVISNALAAPFAAGVLLAPYPWCFVSLLAVEVLGEMWIGVVLAVVMALVPRHVRVTSVALYNFIITNISGLSTTLVPLLRAFYDSPRVFRFLAEPLIGAVDGAAVGGGTSDKTRFAPPEGRSMSSGIGGGKDAESVEFQTTQPGAHGLQAALLWMYPGMYLASSVLCVVAIFALGRDRNEEAAAAGATSTVACTGAATVAAEYDQTAFLDADSASTARRGKSSAETDERGSLTRRDAGAGAGGDDNCADQSRSEAADVPLLHDGEELSDASRGFGAAA